MALDNLIQVGDDVWIDPATVTGVKHWPERYDKALEMTHRDNTVIFLHELWEASA